MIVALEIFQKRRADLVRVHASILLVAFGAPGPKASVDLRCIETLTHQTADDSSTALPIEIGGGDALEPSLDRSVEKSDLVDFREHVIYRFLRGRRTNPQLFDLLQHPSPSAPLDDGA